MSHDAPMEPAFSLRSDRKNGKPWWMVALVTGVGIGAGAVITLGLGGAAAPAHGEPKVVQATTLPPGALSLDDRLKNIEGTLTVLVTEMAEVKARLPPKRP